MPGNACDSRSCRKYGRYEKDKSSTFASVRTQEGLGEAHQDQFYIKYGSGLVKGRVVEDTLGLGACLTTSPNTHAWLGSTKLKKARFGDVGYETGHAFNQGRYQQCSTV